MINSEKGILEELSEAGYKYADAYAIKQKELLEPKEIEIILNWLTAAYSEHAGTADTLVRSLIGAKEAFDPAILIELFENSSLNFSLKSGIGYTLVFAKTFDISEWIRDQLLYKEVTLERRALISGLLEKGGFNNVEELKEFLKGIFDRYPTDEALKLLKKYGNSSDIPFLEEKAANTDKKLSKEILKVIAAIQKRTKA